MTENKNNYGNFAEKEPFGSARGESVVLTAVGKCESLQAQLEQALTKIAQQKTEIEYLKSQIVMIPMIGSAK